MKSSIFNEDRYLQGDKESLELFRKTYESRKKRWDIEQKIFSKTLIKYDQLIEQTAMFIKKLGFKSSLECSLALSYMVNQGFLSQNMLFLDDAPNPEFEITSRYGLSIVRGMGCCRNYAAIHQEIMQKLGYYSKQLYCYEKESIFRTGQNEPANHVISIIEHEDTLYGIDLYNGNRLYRFKRPLVLSEISSMTNYTIRYKPYYELTMGESNLQDIKRFLLFLEGISQKRHMAAFRYEEDIRYPVKRKIFDSSKELREYHYDTHSLKKQIVNEMVEKTFYHK